MCNFPSLWIYRSILLNQWLNQKLITMDTHYKTVNILRLCSINKKTNIVHDRWRMTSKFIEKVHMYLYGFFDDVDERQFLFLRNWIHYNDQEYKISRISKNYNFEQENYRMSRCRERGLNSKIWIRERL